MRYRIGSGAKESTVKLWIVTLGVLAGCKSVPPPGPVLALYQKDGGPVFQKSPDVYDPLVVNAFFKSHPEVLPSFIDHGVCSLRTDPASPEAMPNGVICQEAMVVSMGISMKKYTESNR